MRISGGDFKGRVLKIPRLRTIRPTRAMVRKAVFDVLGSFVTGKAVLDLFSGSGAFGFEALSRGAKSTIFVENKALAQNVIRENALRLHTEQRCRILKGDVFRIFNILKKKELQFQLIFADPPYAHNLAKKCLLKIGNCDIVLPPAIVVIEHGKKDELPEQAGLLTLWQLKKYGDTFVSFYTPG